MSADNNNDINHHHHDDVNNNYMYPSLRYFDASCILCDEDFRTVLTSGNEVDEITRLSGVSYCPRCIKCCRNCSDRDFDSGNTLNLCIECYKLYIEDEHWVDDEDRDIVDEILKDVVDRISNAIIVVDDDIAMAVVDDAGMLFVFSIRINCNILLRSCFFG